MRSVIETLETVPEALREHYEPFNGKFRLRLEDVPPGFVKAEDLTSANAKIVEFRDNNIRLIKEVEELRPLKTKFDGLDPDEARSALEKVKGMSKKGINDPNDVDARLKTMLEEAVRPLRETISQTQAEAAAERQRANDFQFKSRVGEEFTRLGGKPNAIEFVVGLGKGLFEVNQEGQVVAKTGKFSTEKPGEPLTVEEWLKSSVAKEHDYVFNPSNGGGAPLAGGKNTNSGGQPTLKPGQTILKDPTPQQLGEYSRDIAAGKMKVVFTEQTV